MKTNSFLISALVFAGAALAQTSSIPLNTVPSRIVGHAQPEVLTVNNSNPNLVEGREVYSPQAIAVDTSVSPPILYVSDSGNNRVLAWKNAASFTNGQAADLVIGQPDFYHTHPQGPTGIFESGLTEPNGIAIDSNGNLYVADIVNNRVLRYPTPFQQYAKNSSVLPDMWVGQPSLASGAANFGLGTVNAQGLNLAASPYPVNIALDYQNNLWVVDGGNRRVLEFTAASLAQAQQSGFSGLKASLELGQLDFTSNNDAQPTTSTLALSTAFATPVAIAFDASGNLFVSDYSSSYRMGRVLVFSPPFQNGQSAARIMGLPYVVSPNNPPNSQVEMGLPGSMFFISYPNSPSSNMMGVVDTGDSRILLFNSLDSGKWPANVSNSPAATAVWGQPSFTSLNGNQGTTFVPAPTASTLWEASFAVYSGGQLYIADTLNNRVLTVPFTAGAPAPAASAVLGQNNFAMNAPNLIEGREFNFYTGLTGAPADAGVAIDTSGPVPHLYVSDPNNHRILGFNDFRTLTAGSKADIVIGQPDFNSGLCNQTGNPAAPTASSVCYPTGLAVDPNGNLYVADTDNSRVLRFPAPFAYQGPGPEPADLVLGQSQFTFTITDPTSSTMRAPYGLALADHNGLLVSDILYNRVLFIPFDTNSDTFQAGTDNGKAAIKVFGQQDFNSIGSGTGINQFNSPHHISVDNEARLYVADSANNRVMIFDQVNGSLTPATGASSLFQITGLSSPRAVYVNPTTSDIWVADSTSSVKKYPIYENLIDQASATPSTAVEVSYLPLGLAQDQYGDLVVADDSNRVGFYYPAADAINGGNFLPSCISGPASTCRALAPGTLASLCSQGSVCNPSSTLSLFGSTTAANGSLANPYPLPTILGDVRVDMNWTNSDGSQTTQSVPLYYVSPTQINFVVPMAAPASGTTNVTIVQNSTGRVYAAGQVAMYAVSPAILQMQYTGSLRQAAVINLSQVGCSPAPTCYINSTTNPAPRGTFVSVYATGQGFVPNAPADGAAVTSPVNAQATLRVNINGVYLDQMPYDPSSDQSQNQGTPYPWVQYSGLSSFPGLWQINFYLPHAIIQGEQLPLIITADSQASVAPNTYLTTISVK